MARGRAAKSETDNRNYVARYVVFVTSVLTTRLLTAQAECLEKFSVLLDVTVFDVVKHATATSNHHQKPSATVVIFCMSLEVLSEAVDTFCQERDLHFW